MTNEELILQILGELKAGQDELRAGQASLTTRLEKVEAGQAKLETEMCHTRMLVEQQDQHNQPRGRAVQQRGRKVRLAHPKGCADG